MILPSSVTQRGCPHGPGLHSPPARAHASARQRGPGWRFPPQFTLPPSQSRQQPLVFTGTFVDTGLGFGSGIVAVAAGLATGAGGSAAADAAAGAGSAGAAAGAGAGAGGAEGA